MSPALPSQDTAPAGEQQQGGSAGEDGPGSAKLRQIQSRAMVSASPEGITTSWDTPERGSQGWNQNWEPGAGNPFFRQVVIAQENVNGEHRGGRDAVAEMSVL